jgi:transcriptional regulator with PAS, ATPase and Fis domain
LAFIFDELNSLDLDTQGALLRFLESGELLSLGDYKDAHRDVDALIVGVMNENPDTITKVRTIDRIVRDKQVFGGLLGDFLYEFFRGQRRLRDDLYFRMARGGEIVMPELRQRREDIPILFFLTVKKELIPTVQIGKDKWGIELSTYDELMDKSFQWEGNVRELQALAREIFTVALKDYKDQMRRGTRYADKLMLRGTHVRMAKDNLARKSQTGPEILLQTS